MFLKIYSIFQTENCQRDQLVINYKTHKSLYLVRIKELQHTDKCILI